MLKFRKFLLCTVLVLSLVLTGTGTIASFEVVPEDGNAQFLLIDDGHTQILPIDALDIEGHDSFEAASRLRMVTLSDWVSKSESVAVGDELVLNLFSDASYVATIDRVSTNVNDTLCVRGRLQGYQWGYVIITYCDQEGVYVSIEVPEEGRHYILFKVEGELYYVAELDPDKMDVPPEAPPLVPPPPSREEEAEIAALQEYMATSTLGPDDWAIIDVMIVYTQRAEDWAEDEEHPERGGINHQIAQAMEEAQTAMDYSKTYVTLRLVHSARVEYTEDGDSQVDLDQLTYTGPPYDEMDEVHQWRDRYGADLVQLFCNITDAAGRAHLLDDEGGKPAYAFSVVDIEEVLSTTWRYVPAHEMGHNLGCHHHKDDDYPPAEGLYPYSNGWRWKVGNIPYRTVMAGKPGRRVLYFSNPDVFHNGYPTGDPEDGDNARTIREIKHVVAAYRESPEATTLVLSPETDSNPIGTYYHELTATVRDQCNDVMEGVAVKWSISGVGWFLGIPESSTDADGRAYAWIFSNVPGTSTVKCEVVGITQVAAGMNHTVGLKSDGTVVAVGDNNHVPVDVGGWTDIVQVAAGSEHTVGLKSDGTVVAVGNNYSGQCDVGGWTDITQVAAGLYHTVGLKSDGTVVAVGNNNHGQCNFDDGWTGIVQVAAGSEHTVGLKSDGTVVAVGSDWYGQCGVSGWTDITQVAAGMHYTVGLKSNGTVVAVGDNTFGQCNFDDGWMDITQVAAGYFHTVGLKSDGAVVAVGLYSKGQCDVGGWTDITQVAVGLYHTVGLKSDGTVVAVGDSYSGQCNVGGWTGNPSVYATATAYWTCPVAMVAAGYSHTVGLKSDGTVVAVGGNWYGQCDVGVEDGWTDITQIAAGWQHTVGLKSDGTVVAVGWNSKGQCDVDDWENITQVSADAYHTVGLKSDGTVVAVGYNKYGQCDVGVEDGWTDITQIAAGMMHTVGLKSDGTVIAVGYNYPGQCNVDGWTDIVQVAAGEMHTVGLKSDGTVVAVGNDSHGQCDVGDWTDITQIAATWHTVGVKSDGTVVAVGNNDYGQCNVGSWTNITQVAAGHLHTVGLKSGGTVVAVGYNNYGQCGVGGWNLWNL